MAAEKSLESKLKDLNLNDEEKTEECEVDGIKWRMSLQELYVLALHFYKDKSGKAIHLSYAENLKLVAFTQQVLNGPFDIKNVSQLGVLDMIGKDRRSAWQQLGFISKSQSMEGFITLLDNLCPSFKPYVEAVKRDNEERLRLEVEKQKQDAENTEKQRVYQNKLKEREELRNKEEIQRRQLQDALNLQTLNQFKVYAEKQFPRNPEQQAILIRQLQNEHYHQYMQQLHSQICTINDNPSQKIQSSNNSTYNEFGGEGIETDVFATEEKIIESSEKAEYSNLVPAKMWTRPDIKNFKKEVSIGNGDGVINVGHGDTVTVRVPTHESGNCIFWEFATDDYDIGFGVYFEWSKSISNDVTVHVSESDDEDIYEDDDDDDELSTLHDLECGPVPCGKNSTVIQSRPPISIIVPVYRRECQTEVYVGSHNYPGEGVYLLKFDNSFSIWRSKTLYYRVYYER